MSKKLFIVWLTLTILLFSSISIYAEEQIQGKFFTKNVVVNGERVNNYNLQYPFVLYNDTTYIPLTKELCEMYGVELVVDQDSRTITLSKQEISRKAISSNVMKNNGQPLLFKTLSDVTIVVRNAETTDSSVQTVEASGPSIEASGESETSGEAEASREAASDEDVLSEGVLSENKAVSEEKTLTEETLKEETLNTEGFQVLAVDSQIYVPARILAASKILSWDLYFDSNYGLCISTVKGVPAKTFFDEGKANYNKSLTAYITSSNRNISKSGAQELTFMFLRAAEVYGVDEKLLMAIARKESSFNAAATGGGASGVMQIMPDTGRRFGLTPAQLYDPKINIDFGAMYISQRLTAYNGNQTLALSAYNQGSAKVNRGSYSTAYAQRVLTAYEGIKGFVNSNSYSK